MTYDKFTYCEGGHFDGCICQWEGKERVELGRFLDLTRFSIAIYELTDRVREGCTHPYRAADAVDYFLPPIPVFVHVGERDPVGAEDPSYRAPLETAPLVLGELTQAVYGEQTHGTDGAPLKAREEG